MFLDIIHCTPPLFLRVAYLTCLTPRSSSLHTPQFEKYDILSGRENQVSMDILTKLEWYFGIIDSKKNLIKVFHNYTSVRFCFFSKKSSISYNFKWKHGAKWVKWLSGLYMLSEIDFNGSVSGQIERS